ncbi:acetate--CoA ligase family protein [Aliikangiella sp. IMCC44359]|uniref:acetate--CoA ligase family protein n=1 Tax=Aliikangiella sp. IMCC44359 TaxID=3459125 RepID=UPI00403AB92A
MKKALFIPENEIYQYLSEVGINTPKHFFINNKADFANVSLAHGTPVVLKGVATDLWHKSDVGALKFDSFSIEKSADIYDEMFLSLTEQYQWLGLLVCEQVKFQTGKAMPTEIFVSLQRDKCCGAIISFGFGGILTEDFAREMKQSILVWPASVYTPEEALDELEQHWLGKILLGKVRQQSAMLTRQTLLKFLKSLWALDAIMKRDNIELLEVNPFVVNQNGEIVALDGVGLKNEAAEQHACPIPLQDSSFLNPKKIGIVGVSEKKGNIGGLILENIKQSNLKKNEMVIVKPDIKQFSDIACVPDIAHLVNEPVDILIMALPAQASVDMIEQICQQGGGAEVIYIVAGGIGDGADQDGHGERLARLVAKHRENNRWCPAIVGPNGLGMLLSPLKLNTLFIPQKKLNVNFNPDSPVALISQSGAFLITRLSRHSNLSLKYGFSIGNQLDMKLSDFMALMQRDKSVQVLGVYVEGFVDGDVCAVAQLVEAFRRENRHVIIYKGGRSQLGQTAAAGHTGAMTGDYFVQKRLLQKAGAVLVESFNQFNTVFKWMAAYPALKNLGKLAIVTNAGYETVGSVDILGDNDPGRLYEFDQTSYQQLKTILSKHQLHGLVAASNPLDLTPMANESVYFDCVELLVNDGAGVVILGLVPLSEKLDTHQLIETEAFAKKLKNLAAAQSRLIGIVIDAGVPYQEYKVVFEKHGFPVFDGMDMAVLGINVLKQS